MYTQCFIYECHYCKQIKSCILLDNNTDIILSKILLNLGNHCRNININYDLMKKYYLIAIKKEI